MARGSFTPEEVLTLLGETPRRVAALTAGLEPARLRGRPEPDAWSANDVLAHLRACADVWGHCIATMLAEDAPTLRAVNPRTWITRTDYPDLEFGPSLRAFTAQRAELLAALEPLPAETWSRPAMVTGAGKVLRRTVLSYAAWLAHHEQPTDRAHHRLAPPHRPRPTDSPTPPGGGPKATAGSGSGQANLLRGG